jgi:hypothetical protein
MNTKPKTSERRAPVCGVSSAIMPFIGAGVFYAIFYFSTNKDAFGYFFLALGFFLASVAVGIFLALTGVSRHERFRALPWIALLLNIAPLVYFIVAWLRNLV